MLDDLFNTEPDKTAVISDCGRYRYELTRCWDSSLPTVTFIGLNPSTADADKDDATIRRLIDFAKRWGCGRLVMLNLFAFRATEPRDMKKAADPIGPENDARLQAACLNGLVVAMWGSDGGHLDRDERVLHLLDLVRVEVKCFGHTLDGKPRHPLYLAATTPLKPLKS